MLRNRIRSNSGATILLALLFFLLCALAGSIVLSAGSAAAGRISGLKESEQSFYSVTSAAQVMRKEIEGQEFQAYVYAEDGGPDTYVYIKKPDGSLANLLNDAIEKIYKNQGTPSAYEEKGVKIYPSTEKQKDILGTVIADFTMKSDYTIEIILTKEGNDQYICKLTAKALVSEDTSTYEKVIVDKMDNSSRTVQGTRRDIQVYWSECAIDKG